MLTREWPEQYTIAALQAQAEKQSSIAPGPHGGLMVILARALTIVTVAPAFQPPPR